MPYDNEVIHNVGRRFSVRVDISGDGVGLILWSQAKENKLAARHVANAAVFTCSS